MPGFLDRIVSSWNAFKDPDDNLPELRSWGGDYGAMYGMRPDKSRLTFSNEKSIVTSILNRIAIDAASVPIKHIRLDANGRFAEEMVSGLNNCLTTEANVDQGARMFRQDIVMTMLDKGIAAIVPVDTTTDPFKTGSFDVLTARVGDIVAWYPRHVRVRVYNDRAGRREEVTLPKSAVAIVENPLYVVMNEPNSTLQRLIQKLRMLDSADELSASGKLDLIIQLPYVVKSDMRRTQAEQRRKDIEFQLKGSKYGIAYTDGTEKITQLNRPAENNLLTQVEYLTKMLYGQLGLTEEIMNGTADEKTMLNYFNRTIEPILASVVESMRRTFLTKTARTQRQTIDFIRDPFKLVPVNDIAEIADKFARNEILSANEIRSIIGFYPAEDPKADELHNSNMPADKSTPSIPEGVQNGT